MSYNYILHSSVNWKQIMLKTVLIFVLIFAASTSFAGNGYVQNDKNITTALYNIDSQTVFNQDFDDIEFDVVLAAPCLNLSYRINDVPDLNRISPISSSFAHTAIRAPPYHYH